MAELILAVVALGLAAPSVIVSFAQCGTYISDRIKTYKDAPAVLIELQSIAEDVIGGQLKVDLEIAEHAFASDEYDQTLKKSLDFHVRGIAIQLADTVKFIDSIALDHTFQKIWFAAVYEKKARQYTKQLRVLQSNLVGTLQILLAQRQLVTDKLLLKNDRLVPIQTDVTAAESIDGPQYIRRCEYRKSLSEKTISELNVLFEHFPGTEDEVRTTAAHLSRHFSQQLRFRGILPCLGYRVYPQVDPVHGRTIPCAELCFQLPAGSINIESLHNIINHDANTSGVLSRRLEDRFALAHAVAEAVLSVAATGFVHKNIRSNTIMLLQPLEPNDDKALGMPFLTSWLTMRDASKLSARMNLSAGWDENIYRHPTRQGLQVQERYSMGHDIYSLGVCLLEIGLWNTLSIETPQGAVPSAVFKDAAADYYQVAPNELNLMSKFRHADQVRAILLAIAEQHLPGRMGSAYAALVSQCLRCLEGGFGPRIDLRKMGHVDAAVFFNDEILTNFPSLTGP